MSAVVAVVNRAAGGGRAGRTWDELAQGEPRLAAARVIARPEPEAALAELEEVVAAGGVERILVVGGDGTLSRVADHLLKRRSSELEDRSGPPPPALGLVPAGTGSDLARPLRLPREPRAALERALGGEPRPLDALEVAVVDGPRRFALNIVSAGISGQVDEAVNALASRGRTAYLRATLGAFARYRPVPCRIAADGEAWHEGGLLLLAVANGTTFGRGMRIAPEAELDDGLAEAVLVPRLPAWQVPVQLPRLYRGTHLGSRHVRYRRARRVVVEPLAPLPPLDVDGDPWPRGGTEAPIHLILHPGAVRIVA